MPSATTKILINAAIAIVINIIASGCGASSQYSEFTPIDPKGWAYTDTIAFQPLSTDSTACAHLSLTVIHTNDYPYSNIWLEVSSEGERQNWCDTLNITLADIYGRWLGKGVGSTYQQSTTLNRSIGFNHKAKINVRHIMRVDTLRHVTQIGLSASPNDSK